MKHNIPHFILLCFCLAFAVSCNKEIKEEKEKHLSTQNSAKLTEQKSEENSPEEREISNLYVSVKFEESLRNTHSYYVARKDSDHNLFFIGDNAIFTGGNEVDFLTEEELKTIKYKDSNIIEIGNRGIFKLISNSDSNETINKYIIENAYSHKHYSDGINNLSVESDNIAINGEEYSYLLYLGFNQENIDTISSKYSSFFMDLKDNEVFLYKTNPDDYSFGKRGDLVMKLTALD